MEQKTITAGKNVYEVTWVEEGPAYIDGFERRKLTLYITNEDSLDKLNAVFSDSKNTQSIILRNSENNAEQIFDNFTIKVKIARESVPADAVNETPAHEIVIVELAKKTDQEIQNEKILTALAKLGIDI